jgi:hypothetical protein
MTNQTPDAPFTLGRHAIFDEKSRNFNIAEVIKSLAPRSYTWTGAPHLNQSRYPACVGFSWAEELADRPIPVKGVDNSLGLALYNEAQALDGMAMPHDGTSVLAGAKAVQNRGHLDEYRWAFNVDDLFVAVGHQGPAVIGIPWFNGMFTPDVNGFVHQSGALAGGHALSLPGTHAVMISSSGPVNTVTQKVLDHSKSWFRARNHWVNGDGSLWGIAGDCFFTVEELGALLAQLGDACIPMHRR